MVPGKLIRLIESHEEEIARSILRSIRHHPDLAHMSKLPDQELRERGEEILKNLGHWLEHGNEQKLAHEYEGIGRERFAEGIPLHEAVHCLCLVKDKMIDFLDEQGTNHDSLALYAEEQFERRIGHFFDLLLMHLARGYEIAWRHEAHLAV